MCVGRQIGEGVFVTKWCLVRETVQEIEHKV